MFSFCVDQLLLNWNWVAGQSQSWLPTRAGKDDNPSLLSLLPALLKPQSLLGSPEDLCVCFTSSLENHSAIQTKAVLNSFKHRFIFFYFPNPTEREDTVKVLWPGFGIVAMSSTAAPGSPSPRVRKCQQRLGCSWGVQAPGARHPLPQTRVFSETTSLCTGNRLKLFWGNVFFSKTMELHNSMENRKHFWQTLHSQASPNSVFKYTIFSILCTEGSSHS